MEVLPLEALIYNNEKIDINKVVAPPYDVIDKKLQDELYEKEEHNIVRLILNKEENKYEDAKKHFENWKQEEVLIKTKKPAIFYIIQKYENEKWKLIERKGFIARNKIEDFSTKKILPHEFTMGGPKQDRLNLVEKTGAFFSQIFMVYNDEKQIIEEVARKYFDKKPLFDVTDENGVQNIVYLIDDENDLKTIEEAMKNKTLLIADGHHRYETSMNFARKNPENEYAQYVMSYFTNAQDENLVIYPTHRIVEKDFCTKEILEKVGKYYDIEKIDNKEEFLEKIEQENQKQITTGLILKNDSSYYVLKLKNGANKEIEAPEALKKLDLKVLHELILKKELGYKDEELMAQDGIKYEKKEQVAFNSIKTGSASAVFIMAYPKMQDILDISKEGYRMPQKSTYFYPKLLSGIVINPLI